MGCFSSRPNEEKTEPEPVPIPPGSAYSNKPVVPPQQTQPGFAKPVKPFRPEPTYAPVGPQFMGGAAGMRPGQVVPQVGYPTVAYPQQRPGAVVMGPAMGIRPY